MVAGLLWPCVGCDKVALLLYISVAVPIRAGFEVDVALWSATFFVDAVIDVYFVCDIVLNFRTAYYTKGGIREDRPGRICRNYLRGWFMVDFVSTLPISYIGNTHDWPKLPVPYTAASQCILKTCACFHACCSVPDGSKSRPARRITVGRRKYGQWRASIEGTATGAVVKDASRDTYKTVRATGGNWVLDLRRMRKTCVVWSCSAQALCKCSQTGV